MLFLVNVPSLPKRIQRNADSAEEAVTLVWNILPERMRKGISVEDCSADECPDPMNQFLGRSDNDI